MLGTIIRDAIVYLVKRPLLRPLLSGIARKRYDIDIHPTAIIPSSVALPKHIRIEEGAVVLTTATLSPYVTLEANSVLAGAAPRGAYMSGNPAVVVRFRDPTRQKEQAQPLAQEALRTLVDAFEFDTVLDIGCGEGWHATRMVERGKNVTCVDLGDSCYFRKGQNQIGLDVVIGDYMQLDFGRQFDCIWLSHVLEHQLDVQRFLEKIHHDLKEGGVLAVTVPPLKNDIVGGHVNLFNMGLLLYRLVLAGFDCKEAHCKRYGYNLSVILHKRTIELPSIEYDSGDIEKLAPFFPFGAVEGFSGEIDLVNWPWPPKQSFEGPPNH